MAEKVERRILHIDMDAFFAAVEQKRHPELKGKPVVVGGGGDPTQRGVVSTASYEARKFGVHSAMALKIALKLCPTCVFLPVDHKEYSLVSEKIKNILVGFSPLMEDVGIDEAFLDISPIDKKPEEIAQEIKREIKKETGLTCSVGIGPNKLLAKMASDMQKPDGLTFINEGGIETRIWPLGTRKLWGVGPKTEAYLKGKGVQTIGDLAALPLETLTDWVGKSFGEYLYQASRGIDESPIVTHWEPKSMSRETTFQEDIADSKFLKETLESLGEEAVRDLRERGYKARTIAVKVRFSNFKTHTRALTLLEATDSLPEITSAAVDSFERLERKRKVRLIGIRLSGLEKVVSGPESLGRSDPTVGAYPF